jgi:hypothetical protein
MKADLLHLPIFLMGTNPKQIANAEIFLLRVQRPHVRPEKTEGSKKIVLGSTES